VASRAVQAAGVVLVLAAGVAAGWLVGNGKEAEVAEAAPVPFVSATAVGANPFTPPADVPSLVTIKSAQEFGGTGSTYVCDREKLIGFLVTKPDRMRVWARVLAQRTDADSVASYIRELRPVTLVEPTRVTDHAFVDGSAKPSQALLAVGTAVLVDEDDVVRVRCRSGSPLAPPVFAAQEECAGCPEGATVPPPLLDSPSYVVHPSPPPVKGERREQATITRPVTVQVIKRLPADHVERRVSSRADGTTVVRTVTVTRDGKPVVKVKRVKVPGPTRTVVRTRTVRVPVAGAVRTRTVYVERPVVRWRTRTVYEGAG